MIYWYPPYSEDSSFWPYSNSSIQRRALPRELFYFTSCCYGQTALAGALEIFHSFSEGFACHPLRHEFLCVSISAHIHVHFESLSLTFMSSHSADAPWRISFLPLVSGATSVCTKDVWFTPLTHIAV